MFQHFLKHKHTQNTSLQNKNKLKTQEIENEGFKQLCN